MAHPEYVDILDESAHPTGERMTHTGTNLVGAWHAGVHVVLYTRDRRVLLQQRSKAIMFHPGLWEVGVGGVVAAGETVEQAALREVSEEVGAAPFHLEYVTRWKYNHHIPTQGMHMKVFLHAFIAEIDPAHLKLQRSEVQRVRMVPVREAHEALFFHKGLPHVQLMPYEGYYRQLLSAVEKRLGYSVWPELTDTIGSDIKEGIHEEV